MKCEVKIQTGPKKWGDSTSMGGMNPVSIVLISFEVRK